MQNYYYSCYFGGHKFMQKKCTVRCKLVKGTGYSHSLNTLYFSKSSYLGYSVKFYARALKLLYCLLCNKYLGLHHSSFLQNTQGGGQITKPQSRCKCIAQLLIGQIQQYSNKLNLILYEINSNKIAHTVAYYNLF